jgi:DNA-binding transcriptional LysR family regulator
MDTSKLVTFIAAADAGSLSLSARRLGTQLSTVSRQIADLERDLGTALLVRTGRGVRPTVAGERYLERARHIVREVASAAAEARGEVGAALTHLRVSAPVELALRLMPEVLARLHEQHPGASIDVHSDARRVSLVEEKFDAAVRLGALKSSESIARRLGAVSLVLCGSPQAAREVRSVAQLAARDFVLVAGARRELVGSQRGRTVRLELRGSLRVSTFSEAAALAARTSCLVVVPSYTAAEAVQQNTLVRLLPTLVLPRIDAQLVYQPRHRGSVVLRDLGDALAAAIARSEREV